MSGRIRLYDSGQAPSQLFQTRTANSVRSPQTTLNHLHIPRLAKFLSVPVDHLDSGYLCSTACEIPLRPAAGFTGDLNEPSCFSAFFAQITFPKEYEVVLKPALK